VDCWSAAGASVVGTGDEEREERDEGGVGESCVSACKSSVLHMLSGPPIVVAVETGIVYAALG
jgi:hypothetical protein